MKNTSRSTNSNYSKKISAGLLCLFSISLVALQLFNVVNGIFFQLLLLISVLGFFFISYSLLASEKKEKRDKLNEAEYQILMLNNKIDELYKDIAAYQQKSRLDSERIDALSSEIELLCAMREVSLIVSQEVDFKGVITSVLKVLEDILASQELILFKKDETNTNVIRAKAARIAGKDLSDDPAKLLSYDCTRALSSIEHAALIRITENNYISLTVPISVDNHTFGAIEVRFSASQIDETELIRKESMLRQLVNHIALAIKTPTLYDRAVVDSLTGL
ncbi:MAG: hypothetical protein ABIH42_08090, partial [Planctomycetota bacterium]